MSADDGEPRPRKPRRRADDGLPRRQADDGLPKVLIDEFNRGKVRLFRNNNGVATYGNRKVRYGLFPGSGDLIGWHSVAITPDMVGKNVAVFVSIEAKSKKGGAKKAQADWAAAVRAAGGLAIVARSVEDADALFGDE